MPDYHTIVWNFINGSVTLPYTLMVGYSYTTMNQKRTRKLHEKRHRRESGAFIVEGKKNIDELLRSSLTVTKLYTTLDMSAHMEHLVAQYRARTGFSNPEIHIVSESKLVSLGTLKSNNAGLAVATIPQPPSLKNLIAHAQQSILIVLDDVRDPGNLGTIMRTADWFGVTHIVASPTSVDPWSPKVVAASMGSFTRVHVTQCILTHFLENAHACGIPIFGACLDGTSVHTLPPLSHGIIVMGSESHGITPDIATYVDTRITIPRIGNGESLNVGVATAIILGALRRE